MDVYVSIVVLFFELLGSFASCLHCLRLFYNLFCVCRRL